MRKVTGIRRNRGPIKILDKYAAETLAACAKQWETAETACLDTAVRDNVAEGLAYLVWTAYDSISCSKSIGLAEDDYSSSYAFIASSTAQWFRERGFSEWFCIGAGTLFNSQRPRIKSEMLFVKPKRRRRA